MKTLKYKKNKNEYVELRILNNYEITKSSQEIAYSDLTCDFTGYTADDLPEKYQEVKLVEGSGKLEPIWEDTTKKGKLIKYNSKKETRIKEYEIYGNTYQQTYTGKNLLKNTATNSGDNNYWEQYSTYDQATGTLTRSTTATTESYITHRINGIKNSTKYTISFMAKSNGKVKNMDIYLFNRQTQGICSTRNITLSTTYQKYTFTFTTDSSTDYSTNSVVRIDNNGSTTSGTTATLTIKDVMLVEGEDTNFEPYVGGTPSPNPDYPQAIQNVTGRQTIDVVGKNLWIPTLTNNGSNISPTNCTATLSGDEYTFTATGSDMQFGQISPAGNTYTNSLGTLYGVNNATSISILLTNSLFARNYITFYNSNKVSLGYTRIDSNTGSVNVPTGAVYFSWRIGILGATTGTAYKTKVMTSYSTATTYEPYKGNTYEVNLGKNLLDTSDITTTSYITNNGDGSITLNGTGTGGISFPLSKPFVLKANTTYTLSLTNTNSSYSNALFALRNGDTNIIIINYNQNSVSYTPTNDIVIDIIRIYSPAEITFNSFTFSVQLEKGSQATSYSSYFTPIELNKIGNYQDYIYKNNGTWYKMPNILKIESYNGETITTDYKSTTGGLDIGATIYYGNNNPEPIEITNTELINQLENIINKKINIGENEIYLDSNTTLEMTLSEIVGEKYENENVLFFGYVDSYNFNEMREVDKFMEINLTLLSPMKLTTLRTFTAIGTYQLKTLIQNIILSPLVNDGFIIDTIDISDRTLTVNYLAETIEFGLNDLSNKYNFWWYIDEEKKIYIRDIEKMLSQDSKYIYDDSNKIDGLQYLKPTIISDNYANVVNFKNVRIYEYSDWQYLNGEIIVNQNGLLREQISTLKKDGKIDFQYPVDIKPENLKKAGESYLIKDTYYAIRVFGTYSDNSTFEFYIRYDVENNNYVMSNNIGFDGDEDSTKEFLLIRDSFFNNLITGFKYNNENKNVKSIEIIMSDSALIWNINKFYNDKAINDKKGIINNTGIVELTIDMNEQWKTRQELQEIGMSYIDKNSLKLDGEIELKLDKNLFNIGDIFKIDKILFNNKYIITKMRESFDNGVIEYYVTCKNSNITDNYIDLFRSPTSQQNEEKIYQINISHYNEEGIKETFEVVR